MIKTDYELLDSQLHALLDGERDALAATGNFVALLYNALTEINWLGVYVLRARPRTVPGKTRVCAHRAR